MNEAVIRDYRRELVLYVLAHTQSGTAAELAAKAQGSAEAEGHPRRLWQGLIPTEVAGILRVLVNQRVAVRAGEQREGRSGLDRPVWRYALSREAAQRVEMPEPPVDAAASDASPYAGMTRTQLYALLEVGDIAMAELSRLQQEFMSTLQQSMRVNARMRQRLAEVGLMDAEGAQG